MTQPQPYDMSNPVDRARWFREMKGFLSLAGEDNFLIQGTDREGRLYAWEAFLKIGDELMNQNILLQCQTCKLRETRACVSHGYPENTIPPSCSCKLGEDAEEALRNLTGTFIDVWTSEHDKKVRENAFKEILEKITELSGDGECMFEMNSERCLSYKNCTICCVNHCVESLKGGTPVPKEK